MTTLNDFENTLEWTPILHDHIDTLRDMLHSRPDLWKQISELAGVGPRTVPGLARNESRYRNPTLSTLTQIAEAFEALTSLEP